MSGNTDQKLNMSLDALIKKRRTAAVKRGEASGSYQGPPSNFQPRSGQSGNPPAERGDYTESSGGGRGRGRGPRPPSHRPPNCPQQAYTGTGFMMPNFGMPFGSFPAHQMSMNQGQGGMNGFHPMMGGAPLPPGLSPSETAALHQWNPDAEPFVPVQPAPPAEPPQPVAVPQARLEPVSQEVRVSFRNQDVVRISKDGSMTIDTKGVRGPAMFMALNSILKICGVSITRPKNAKADDEWSVSDGRRLTRFTDGMQVLAFKGYKTKERGQKVLEAFGEVDPSAAAAATAASNAAARAAGIFPPKPGGKQTDPGPVRNAGLHPPTQPNGDDGEPRPFYGPADLGFGRSEDDKDRTRRPEYGKSQEDKDMIRRLKTKGRYRPYP